MILVADGVIWGLVLALFSHPDAVSIAEVEFNEKSRCFEVALRVVPASLDRALAMVEQPLSQEGKPDRVPVLLSYLQERFLLKSTTPQTAQSDVPRPAYRYVGEQEVRGMKWIYFEIPWDRPTDGLAVRSTIFFELYPEQTNTVLLQLGKKSASVTLDRRRSEQRVLWRSAGTRGGALQPGIKF